MQHYLTYPTSDTYACGADAVGRRNTSTDIDPAITTCAGCRRYIADVGIGKICRINRCNEPARWLVTILGHPNSPPEIRSAYCHKHAEERGKLLWDESPRPYTVSLQGPYVDGVPL